jgi:type II secretion system protein N
MKILRIVGLVAFFLFSFVVGLYVTFPWNTLKDRIAIQISEATGWEVEAKSLEPSWLTGVRIEGLKLEPPEVSEPLVLDEVVARARLLSFLTGGMGVSAWLPIGQGELDVTLAKCSEETLVRAKANAVELGMVPGFAALTGLPLSGQLDLDADVTLDQKDAAESSGRVKLSGTNLELGEGGKVANFPIPALRLGNLDWEMDIDNGKIELPQQQMRGGDVDLDVEGTIDLATPIERTTLNVNVSFRPTPEYLEENGLIKALLNNINRAKGSDGFYTYAITGSVKHPRPFPRRR